MSGAKFWWENESVWLKGGDTIIVCPQRTQTGIFGTVSPQQDRKDGGEKIQNWWFGLV